MVLFSVYYKILNKSCLGGMLVYMSLNICSFCFFVLLLLFVFYQGYIQFIKMCLISNDMGVTSGMFSHDVFTVSSKLAVFLFYPAEKLPVTN